MDNKTIHPVDIYVGKRIRHRRWVVGMTQQQLGKKAGVKFQQIQKYETGANRVSASRLWQIAEALEVPVTWFWEGYAPEAKNEAPMPENLLADREALELVRAYYAMPENQRRRLFELTRAMSEVA